MEISAVLGVLTKMQARLGETVSYRLAIGEGGVDMNQLIGYPLTLRHTGKISCVHCGRDTKKSFNQGYCYPCFTALAQCDICILKPETCHYHQGTCREPEWGERFCFQPHVVYLANASGIKVGITRQTQIPTRWIDQGAIQALPMMQTVSRYVSGLVEVAIGRYVSDKTSWQQMLKNNTSPVDLKARREELTALCGKELDDIKRRFGEAAVQFLPDAESIDISYPVQRYPDKVKSFNFDKQSEVGGVLEGIKGQYLLFDKGVINIRKFSGYQVDFLADCNR